MEGIPPPDLKAWRKRKEIEAGITPEMLMEDKRPKIDKSLIPQDELKRQLRVHKDLMEGRIAPSVAAQAFSGGAAPPPMPMMPPMPAMPFPGGMPPPPLGMAGYALRHYPSQSSSDRIHPC